MLRGTGTVPGHNLHIHDVKIRFDEFLYDVWMVHLGELDIWSWSPGISKSEAVFDNWPLAHWELGGALKMNISHASPSAALVHLQLHFCLAQLWPSPPCHQLAAHKESLFRSLSWTHKWPRRKSELTEPDQLKFGCSVYEAAGHFALSISSLWWSVGDHYIVDQHGCHIYQQKWSVTILAERDACSILFIFRMFTYVHHVQGTHDHGSCPVSPICGIHSRPWHGNWDPSPSHEIWGHFHHD